MKALAWTLFLLGLACSTLAGATVNFAQITDPHIFDGKGEIARNKECLRWCIDQINKRLAAGENYNFVVMTGDLGLEGLTDKSPDPQQPLDNAAKELGAMIRDSHVKPWMFVPGNNDLVREDPSTIWIYRDFIQALQARGKTGDRKFDGRVILARSPPQRVSCQSQERTLKTSRIGFLS